MILSNVSSPGLWELTYTWFGLSGENWSFLCAGYLLYTFCKRSFHWLSHCPAAASTTTNLSGGKLCWCLFWPKAGTVHHWDVIRWLCSHAEEGFKMLGGGEHTRGKYLANYEWKRCLFNDSLVGDQLTSMLVSLSAVSGDSVQAHVNL